MLVNILCKKLGIVVIITTNNFNSANWLIQNLVAVVQFFLHKGIVQSSQPH